MSDQYVGGSVSAGLADVLEKPIPTFSPNDGPHVCPNCCAAFVTVSDPAPGDPSQIMPTTTGCEIPLSCSSCGHTYMRELSERELEAFDQELDRQFSDMLWALEAIWHENESERIDRFVAALMEDQILPEDF